jgi:hypothetical protein
MLRLFIFICCLSLFACVMHEPIVSPETRTKQADHLAKTVGWKEHTIHTSLFTLKAYGSYPLKQPPTELQLFH